MILIVAWCAAAAVAVAIGVLTVSLLASSMKDRGPIGTAVGETVGVGATTPSPGTSSPTTPSPGTSSSPATAGQVFSGEYGEFEVACDGVWASTVAVRPASGWREVSRETGPDDDVDAVFSDGVQEVEVTVFCNRGVPTLDEVEFDTLGSD